jgi:nitrogen regulatory protein PII
MAACMKVVVAIIKPFKLNDVHNALYALSVSGMTVYEAKGHGDAKGHAQIVGSVEYVGSFVPKLRVEVIVPDSLASAVVKAIMEAARTGQRGDGKIYVTSAEEVYKIRTGETGSGAL